MSGKRSRANFEADLRAQQSPFVAFGTPLPPLDPDVRDDGSYVPVWKQEVRDERGLKRLHGAFTGGFSAGYYNTVGSKEGWTPSTFVSSRTNRKKDEPQAAQQRPEDFMDEEDMADAEDEKRVQTAEGFAGLGSTQNDANRCGAFVDLFRIEGETVGIKLLKKMGWKEGQGVGPKVRRKARLDGVERAADETNATYLFAPENTLMISFIKKNDHKGLGFNGETKLSSNRAREDTVKSDDEDDDGGFLALKTAKKKKNSARGGIGIGILNDTGSDDEDPYEIGPRISYNKVIGGDKKKKKSAKGGINPQLLSKPVFISKKTAMARASANFRRCHDGRLPLDGFMLSSKDEFVSVIRTHDEYAPPQIPEGWVSSKQPKDRPVEASYLSTSEAAKASKLDPISRASILGEAALPGKSVFDFLTPAARERLVSASGKSNLPAALGEIPQGYRMTDEERQKECAAQIPKVEKYTAEAALSRGASGFMPYGEDQKKRSRYRAYLENQAGINPDIPAKAPAAKLGMYGPMTRSSADWYPSRLLCKRFNVKPPAHVQPGATEHGGESEAPKKTAPDVISQSAIDEMMRESYSQRNDAIGSKAPEVMPVSVPVESPSEKIVVDADRNHALEGQKAGEAVFKAIFGDDSDED
ncbi:DUF1604 domain protein [Diplocarpon rosae]|nr:DUF1604 domain protein [Diplocarpon rosae]